VQHSGKRGTTDEKWRRKMEIFLKRLFPECLLLALGETSLFP
jgi:hypothetical protein